MAVPEIMVNGREISVREETGDLSLTKYYLDTIDIHSISSNRRSSYSDVKDRQMFFITSLQGKPENTQSSIHNPKQLRKHVSHNITINSRL